MSALPTTLDAKTLIECFAHEDIKPEQARKILSYFLGSCFHDGIKLAIADFSIEEYKGIRSNSGSKEIIKAISILDDWRSE